MSTLAECVIDLSEYRKTSECGCGAFSSVYQYTHKSSAEIIAVKRLSKDVEAPETQTMFFREVTILLSLRNPCILPFRGFALPTERRARFEIVTEFMPNGTVQDHEGRESRGVAAPEWNGTCKAKVIFGTACGMAFVHRTHIIHRDLKAENIFLDGNWEPVIADFGLSKDVSAEQVMGMSAVMGTPFYMAPELFGDNISSASYPVDVYAWGVIVLSLFTHGGFQFPGARITGITQLVVTLQSGGRFVIPKEVPELLRDLIARCWDADPENRPPFDEIVTILDCWDEWLPEMDVAEFQDYKTKILEFDGSPPAQDEEEVGETEEFDFS
jgi:serine/threonine protein kinase